MRLHRFEVMVAALGFAYGVCLAAWPAEVISGSVVIAIIVGLCVLLVDAELDWEAEIKRKAPR
jgi:hypothetical protein